MSRENNKISWFWSTIEIEPGWFQVEKFWSWFVRIGLRFSVREALGGASGAFPVIELFRSGSGPRLFFLVFPI